MPEDQTSIERTLAGETAAFRSLIERYQGAVFTLVRSLVANPADQEEIAQDVFLSAFANLSRFDSRLAAFPTWLLRIARNRCVNWRKRRREVAWVDGIEPATGEAPPLIAARGELRSRLDRALAGLSVEQRAAFVMAEFLDLPHAQIAEVEGIAVGTVKSRLARARQRLQRALRESRQTR